MKTRLQKVAEDLLAITGRNTQSKKSINGGENSELIPIDLIIDIFLRLPAKSIARCRCVSKLWASTLGLAYFTEFFWTRSLAHPQLLFACKSNDEVFLFSSPQPQNPAEQSSHVAASYLMKITYDYEFERFNPIRGLVFLRDQRTLKGKKHKVPVICNPSTRQSLALPKVKTRKMIGVMMKRGILGYDPINKQYKVLSMTWVINGRREEASVEHQVLTLGTENPSWRKIKCCIPHCPEYGEISEICINGVLYYQAVNIMSSFDPIIICFDVRSETFRFTKVLESFTRTWVNPLLINYNGQLGLLIGSGGTQFVNGRSTSIKMGVLQDVEKQEWSEHIYVLPALWQNIVGDAYLCCVGVIRKNEIVLSSYYQNMPFYVFYYNTETTTITRVGFQGMEALKGNRVYTYLDHVENMTLL